MSHPRGATAPAGWRRAGTGFPVAPTAAEQPQPVPSRARPDGSPYATPWVRHQARVRGVHLPRTADGRVRLPDLHGATPPVALHAAGSEVDVTTLWRSVDGRTSALIALLVEAAVRALGRLGRGTDVQVRSNDDVMLIRDAGQLSPTGLLARLSDGDAGGGAPVLVLTHDGAAGPDWGFTPPPAGAALSLTVGAVRRRVSVVDVDGAASVAVRSVLALTLVQDGSISHAAATRLLADVRHALETAGPTSLRAGSPGDG